MMPSRKRNVKLVGKLWPGKRTKASSTKGHTRRSMKMKDPELYSGWAPTKTRKETTGRRRITEI